MMRAERRRGGGRRRPRVAHGAARHRQAIDLLGDDHRGSRSRTTTTRRWSTPRWPARGRLQPHAAAGRARARRGGAGAARRHGATRVQPRAHPPRAPRRPDRSAEPIAAPRAARARARTVALRDGGHSGLLFLDLDRFKLVNDSYGHLAGDKLLVSVARRLRASLPAAHTLARLSGDEFVVLVEDVKEIDAVTDIAEHLLDGAARAARPRRPPDLPVRLDRRRPHPQPGRSATTRSPLPMPPRTPRRRPAATASGCRRPTRSRSRAPASTWRPACVRACRTGTSTWSYQPIVTRRTSRRRRREALVRWADPGRGMIAPDQFIGLAEETGLIVPLGRWVLETSVRRRTNGPGFTLSCRR